MILNYAPSLNNEQIEKLSRDTRGLIQSDIENVSMNICGKEVLHINLIIPLIHAIPIRETGVNILLILHGLSMFLKI